MSWRGAVDVPLNTDYRGPLAHAVNTAGGVDRGRDDAGAPRTARGGRRESGTCHTSYCSTSREPAPHDRCGSCPTRRGRRAGRPSRRRGRSDGTSPRSSSRLARRGRRRGCSCHGPSSTPRRSTRSRSATSARRHDVPAERHLPPRPKVRAVAMGMLDGRVVVRDRTRPPRSWDDIPRHQCTTTVLISSMVPLVTAAEPVARGRVDAVARRADGPRRPDRRRFKGRFNVRVSTCFDMTEVSVPINAGWTVDNSEPRCVRAPPDRGRRPRSSTSTTARSRRRVGELIVRADEPGRSTPATSACPRRPPRPGATAGSTPATRFRCDEDGNFYFVDRIKDCDPPPRREHLSFEVEAGSTSTRTCSRARPSACPPSSARTRSRSSSCCGPGRPSPAELVEFLAACPASWSPATSRSSTRCRRRRRTGSRRRGFVTGRRDQRPLIAKLRRIGERRRAVATAGGRCANGIDRRRTDVEAADRQPGRDRHPDRPRRRRAGIADGRRHSDDDAASLHVRRADEAVALRGAGARGVPRHRAARRRGPGATAATRSTRATGSWPRTPRSPGAAPTAGITFVGPSPETLDAVRRQGPRPRRWPCRRACRSSPGISEPVDVGDGRGVPGRRCRPGRR